MTPPSLEDIAKAQAGWQAALRSRNAEAHALSSLRRLREVLHRLQTNLETLGYPILALTTPCPSGVKTRVAAIQRATGHAVPPILSSISTEIGGISLVDLAHYSHLEFWKSHKLDGPACDGVHVYACDSEWKSFILAEYHEWVELDENEQEETPFVFPIAPDALHKDNVSGDEPYAVVPGSGWGARLTGFSWHGKRPNTAPTTPPDVLSYLRTSILECAGFPGLYGKKAFEPLRRKILAGVPVF